MHANMQGAFLPVLHPPFSYSESLFPASCGLDNLPLRIQGSVDVTFSGQPSVNLLSPTTKAWFEGPTTCV